MSILGLHSKDRKSTQEKANISNPIVSRCCPQYTTSRTSADLDPQYNIYHWGSTVLGVSTLCVGHDSRYICYLNACLCTPQIRLDTCKLNFYWYAGVCWFYHVSLSVCLSVCLSFFCLSICLSFCLSLCLPVYLYVRRLFVDGLVSAS